VLPRHYQRAWTAIVFDPWQLQDHRIDDQSNVYKSVSLSSVGGQVLCVENCVLRVKSGLIFCGITDKSFTFGESNVWWSHTVSLIICNDFNICIVGPDLPTKSAFTRKHQKESYGNARISCSEIDAEKC
jgi:hypothetical protein